MPTNKTPNYQLSQWERDDRVLMEDFNADNAKIDAALKAQAGAMAGKADAAAVAALETIVAANKTAVSRRGNCEISFSSYQGSCTMSDPKSRVLSFSHRPLFIAVMTDESTCLYAVNGAEWAVARAGGASASVNLAWSGNSVTLSGSSPEYYNLSGTTYRVVALMKATD